MLHMFSQKGSVDVTPQFARCNVHVQFISACHFHREDLGQMLGLGLVIPTLTDLKAAVKIVKVSWHEVFCADD